MDKEVDIRAAFQPIFNTLSGKVAFFETNLRVDGSTDKQFHLCLLSISERLGFTHFIDRHMLQMACRSLLGQEWIISTNIAQGSVATDFEPLIACVRDNPVSKQLIIEITESSWCSREVIAEFCRQVRAEGCLLAVDDFGEGFCDLSLVEAMQPDIIKLVLEDDEANNRVKLYETVKLANEFDAVVVVERVDTVQKVRLAEEFKVDFMQGFILAKPMRLADVAEAVHLTVEKSLAPHLVEARALEAIRRYESRAITALSPQAASSSR